MTEGYQASGPDHSPDVDVSEGALSVAGFWRVADSRFRWGLRPATSASVWNGLAISSGMAAFGALPPFTRTRFLRDLSDCPT